MKPYGEMDEEMKTYVIFAFGRKFGITVRAATDWLENHPEFQARELSYLEVADDRWCGIMREILWGDKSDEEIATICEGG